MEDTEFLASAGMGEQPTDAAGHRARLRKRLFEAGPKALLDHELIEYLLALTIPRVDTKEQAKKLISQFGSVGALLSASAATLKREGLSDAAIAALKIAEATALRLLETRVEAGPCCPTGRRLAIISRRRWPIRRSRKSASCSSTPRIC
jgi:DNA repair protein RadC